jgi:Family of unknown function (DUF5752)
MSNGTRAAAEPFQFFTVDGIARTEDRKANTVRELLHGLETCSDDSIYHHMIQVPSSEEFVNGNASNDFAKWVRAMPECGGLSEQLAALDERYYSSIEEMRNDLRRVVGEYLSAYPECADQVARIPFYFCEGLELGMVPLELTARTLEEFRRSVRTMSIESLYLHFVASASRAEMQNNDFSIWLSESLGLHELARKINEIDLTAHTLESARESILQLIDAELVRLV